MNEESLQIMLGALKKTGDDSIQIDELLAWLFHPNSCSIDEADRGRAPEDPDRGGYGWLRHANDEPDRAARRGVSQLTQEAIDCRGYVFGGSMMVRLEHVDAMLAGTRVVSPSVGEWPNEYRDRAALPFADWSKATTISVKKQVVLEAAVDSCRAGRRVVAVNAASAFHMGGGFTTGGRHALEEAMCEQTTLYRSLEKAAALAEAAGVGPPEWVRPAKRRDDSEWHSHVPDDGVVLSPFVEVFRGGTYSGYPFEDVPTMLDGILSVAMPNCNDRMSDSPVDAHPDAEKYEAQVERKWFAVLTAAAAFTEADCLVVPDAGCGVFRNPAAKVGTVLGRLLHKDFAGRFAEVIIAFPGGRNGEEFAEHAVAAFEGRSALAENNNVASTHMASTSAPPTSGFVWEFSVRSGFEPFHDECQEPVERLYVAFQGGGAAEGEVPCRGKVIVVNFEKMTQHLKGSTRCRNIRRRA